MKAFPSLFSSPSHHTHTHTGRGGRLSCRRGGIEMAVSRKSSMKAAWLSTKSMTSLMLLIRTMKRIMTPAGGRGVGYFWSLSACLPCVLPACVIGVCVCLFFFYARSIAQQCIGRFLQGCVWHMVVDLSHVPVVLTGGISGALQWGSQRPPTFSPTTTTTATTHQPSHPHKHWKWFSSSSSSKPDDALLVKVTYK